ncbi:MAG: hypothetical protein ACT4PT_01370 [Methanobacteriota archaeon]
MGTLRIVVTMMAVVGLVAAFSPAASARSFVCWEGDPGCPYHHLVCVDAAPTQNPFWGKWDACVYDPCTTMACF